MHLQPQDLSIEEIRAYLGCQGELDEKTKQQIEWGIQKAANLSHPRLIWQEFHINRSIEELLLEGTTLSLKGKDIHKHLAECSQAAILAVTIGVEAEKELRKLQITGLSDALVLDCCLSAAAEAICEKLYRQKEIDFAAKGLFLTERFSPGYGDLPLTLQKELLDLLDAPRKIGLTATSDGILLPRKSVTAVIGIAPTPQPHRITGCRDCPRYETCHIRKEGTTCGQ